MFLPLEVIASFFMLKEIRHSEDYIKEAEIMVSRLNVLK